MSGHKRKPMNMLEMEQLIDGLQNANEILTKDVEFYKQTVVDMRIDHAIFKEHISTLTRVIGIFEKVIDGKK